MKQIIPFKQELLFKTKVSEITSISLEHTLTLKEDDLITGEFHITGDYKMTEGSINREKFKFKLPFDIALDSRYDISSIIIDIDNFYYEIINNESLQVNIDVYVEGKKQEEQLIEKDSKPEESITIEKTEEVFLPKKEEKTIIEERTLPINEEELIEEFIQTIEPIEPKKVILPSNEQEQFNIFENLDNQETYMTYYVYIVKETDTIETILTKYNTSKEEIALYNNIEDIKPGTKIIIPSKYNE